ncbi:cutinase family protein [Streptomyces ovatisporus]|uniref:Cutinase family protein n=1 Tax=Streptomyces ovatisporus TaxID=1128682 RepID=A0ABV9A404_9ACTN
MRSDDTWTIAVGGAGDQQARVFTDANAAAVDQPVGYSAALFGLSTRQGVDELNRLVREHRAANPDQHIKVIGYSQGAAVVHTWTSENAGTIDNVNSVLIADPKRLGGPGTGTDGLSGQPLGQIAGPPTSGVDQNFGNIPTTSVCTGDVICDSSAPSGWGGYLNGDHGNYSFNADDYADNGNGQWFNGQYRPW